jgi:hypothetical protein
MPDFPRAVLRGIRSELEDLGLVTEPQLSVYSWGAKYRYGIVVYYKASQPFAAYVHVGNVYCHEHELLVIRPGEIVARMEGDLKVFDLEDPEAIPQAIAALLRWVPAAELKRPYSPSLAKVGMGS